MDAVKYWERDRVGGVTLCTLAILWWVFKVHVGAFARGTAFSNRTYSQTFTSKRLRYSLGLHKVASEHRLPAWQSVLLVRI